jgi:hypothetical protein
MKTPPSQRRARASLRRLTTPHALDFSARLLDRSEDGVLTFREFVRTARELVREQPDRSATYLAALVALDMGAGDEDGAPPRPAPSRN